MNCREFVDFLMAYISEELPAPQRDEFKKHVDHCPPCVRYLDQYAHTVTLGKRAYDDPAHCAEAPEALVQAILAARKKGD